MNYLDQLILDYGDQAGLTGLALPELGALSLEFDDGIQIHLDELDEKLVIYSQVGTAGEDQHARLELLLSANLMWRETDGATLSLDPYSRAVILAKSYTPLELNTVYDLQSALDKFCQLTQSWREALR